MMSYENQQPSDEMVERENRRFRWYRNRWVHSLLGLSIMVLCVFILSWTREQLEIPTYKNQNQAAFNLADLFKSKQTTTIPYEEITKVLLVTYNRGGSTFMGETFNRNPNSFYWFEPLAAIYESKYGAEAHNMASIHPDDAFFNTDFTMEERQATFDVFHNIFDCSLTRIPSSIYTHRFMIKGAWLKATKMQPYKECLYSPNLKKRDNTEVGILGNKTLPTHIQACIPSLVSECMASPVRAIKTIRLRMSMIEGILKEDPHIKVIHLVRDPRGILSSRHKTHQHDEVYSLDKIEAASVKLCQIMRKDKKQFNELESRRKRSVLRIRYEDLAVRPLITTVRIYRFLELDTSEQVLDAMHHLTHGDEEQAGGTSTKRVNGSATAYSWMRDLPENILAKLQTNCEDVIRGYDYPML